MTARPDSGRAAPRIPLVVLPVDGEVWHRPDLTAGQRRCLGGAVRSLERLGRTLRRSTGRSRRLDRSIEAAAGSACRLLAAMAEALPVREAGETSPAVQVHACFGVRAVGIGAEQAAAQTAAIVFRVLADIESVLLDVNDLEAEVAGIRALLIRAFGDPGRAGDGSRPLPARLPPDFRPAGDGLERWVLAHHLYFLLNLHAAAAVRAASRAVDSDPAAAAGLLGEGAVFVRALTAAMLHSGSVSAAYYGAVVRPTMQPPAVPLLLTGLMQPEHASYRAALAGLLEASPEPFLRLARRHPELALARDALLEADLLDIERHTSVAAALVGSGHSLVQHDQAPENAVATLRRMRHERAARYAGLMRFGDAAAAELVQPPAGAPR